MVKQTSVENKKINSFDGYLILAVSVNEVKPFPSSDVLLYSADEIPKLLRMTNFAQKSKLKSHNL